MITFTQEELRFLETEFGISAEQAAALEEDRLLELADACFDIELEGDLQDGASMPDRCGVAAGIVTKINELY